MMRYISNTGGGKPVDFETAILDGFAADGGLYVPETLPHISKKQLEDWKDHEYIDLAFEILSLFIDRSIIPEVELRLLLKKAYAPFEKETIIPIHQLRSREETYIMELFYGPTLSFKDIGLAFLVNLVNLFLERKKERLTLIVATTGDTGPATAYFTAGKSNLDAWILYPKEKITAEQERQMTTLSHPNVHPVGVYHCLDGGDDLDAVISNLFADQSFKEKMKLSSVNSINWGRVMMQTVHFFYGYFQVVDTIGEELTMAVPSGAFGNLCAGGLARKMGLPISTFIVANNKNACLHRIFSEGVFSKKTLYETASSAIDILIPYNFWRYLYFCVDHDTEKIKAWMHQLKTTESVRFDTKTHKQFSEGFQSYSASDNQTLAVIKEIYNAENYLLDPHGAVSLVAADSLQKSGKHQKVMCLATAHPAKFPAIIKKALQTDILPDMARHPSLETARKRCQKGYHCDHDHLQEALIHAMENHRKLTQL